MAVSVLVPENASVQSLETTIAEAYFVAGPVSVRPLNVTEEAPPPGTKRRKRPLVVLPATVAVPVRFTMPVDFTKVQPVPEWSASPETTSSLTMRYPVTVTVPPSSMVYEK